MRLVPLTIIAVLVGCDGTNGGMTIGLKTAMAYGKMSELNNSNRSADLLVRLYQVPVMDGSCFVETHGVCRYRYYVTVSTFDEQPETNVFKLSHEGEVTGVAWQTEDKPDYVEIELALGQYTQAALKNNPALKNTTSKLLLKLSPRAMEEIVR